MSHVMARLPRRSIVTLFALVLLALTTPAALALAQQFGVPPQYGAPCPPPGFPPQPGVPLQPGCSSGAIQQPFS